MSSFYKVGCDKEKFPCCFDLTDDSELTPVGRRAYGFIPWSPWAKGEGPSDFTIGYRDLEAWRRKSWISFTAMAKFRFCASGATALVMPTTLPVASKSGAPELPGLSGV